MANLPVPSPRTFTVNETETAANLNSIRDALLFLLNKPQAKVTQSSVQTIGTGSIVAITFDASTVDTYGGHSNSTNNSRYTAQVAGWYWVHGVVSWNNVSGGNRGSEIHKNGSATAEGLQALPAGTINIFTAVGATALVQMNVGDYVELWGFQDSGANLNTHAGSYLLVMWDHA